MKTVLRLLNEINTVRSKDRSKLMRAKNKLKEAIKNADEVKSWLVIEAESKNWITQDFKDLEDNRDKVVKILSLCIVLIFALSSIAILMRDFFK